MRERGPDRPPGLSGAPEEAEAFVTPSPLPSWARIGIGAAAEVTFLSYVLFFGHRAVAAGLTADIEAPPDTLPVAA